MGKQSRSKQKRQRTALEKQPSAFSDQPSTQIRNPKSEIRNPAKPAAQIQKPRSVPIRRSPFASRHFLLLLFGVGLAAVVVYLNGIPGNFVFDDKLIVRDPRVHLQEPFWRIFVTDYWYKYIGTSADLYRPLTIASYAINFAVSGLYSPAFHVVNIVLHALVCVVLVLLVDAVLGDQRVAVVSGLLYATHPIHTEAVTGIVGRAEIMAALFLLVALYLHARRYEVWRWGRGVWLPVALLSYFCALLSKETAIVGPGLLLLVDYVQRRVEEAAVSAQPSAVSANSKFEIRNSKLPPIFTPRALIALAGYIAVAALYVFIRYLVVGKLLQDPAPKSYYLLFGHPLWTRFLTGMHIFAIYVRLLFFPLTLSADYSYRQVPLSESLNSIGPVLGMLAALGFVTAFVWAWRRRVWPLVFGLGFFAIAYSIVANLIVPIGVLVAERLLYLPSVGFCISLAWAGVALARRLAPRLAGTALRHAPALLLAVVVLLYSARTFARNFDWYSHETLYAATVKAAPECHAAHFNYAAVLMRDSKRPGADQLALQELLKAYAIRPDHYPSLVNLTILYMRLGQLGKAHDMALQGLKVSPTSRKLKNLLRMIERRMKK